MTRCDELNLYWLWCLYHLEVLCIMKIEDCVRLTHLFMAVKRALYAAVILSLIVFFPVLGMVLDRLGAHVNLLSEWQVMMGLWAVIAALLLSNMVLLLTDNERLNRQVVLLGVEPLLLHYEVLSWLIMAGMLLLLQVVPLGYAMFGFTDLSIKLVVGGLFLAWVSVGTYGYYAEYLAVKRMVFAEQRLQN
jgi:hypothetical protein